MNKFQKIIGAMASAPLDKLKPVELYDNISKQLNFKRDDWIDALLETHKKFPVIAYDFIKRKKIKIKSKDKYIKYLKKLKSDYFKTYAVSFIYDLYAKMMNPIQKTIEKKINKGAKSDENQSVE